MRSFFGRLHRRYGRRRTGSELMHLADLHRQRFEASLPLGTITPPLRTGASPGSVLIIGGGFAGTAAASVLCGQNFNVTLVEASASLGGRVSSSTAVVQDRIIERGAELIGLNHPTWILLAEQLGLGLSVVTNDDIVSAAGLAPPIQINGRSYTDTDAKILYEAMSNVIGEWATTATSTLPGRMAWAPWTVKNAVELDAQSLSSQIPETTAPDVADAISLSFYLDNTVAPATQSWLANLAQISAGTLADSNDPLSFFSDTEIFRCESGNQALATALAAQAGSVGELRILLQTQVTSLVTDGTTVTTVIDGTTSTFDYAIIAVPVTMLSNVRIIPASTQSGSIITGQVIAQTESGDAVKYLAPTNARYWIPQGLAPLGFSDQIGMTWEGTDNQIGGGSVELSVFAGGQVATQARQTSDVDTYFQSGLSQLFGPGSFVNAQFADWPSMPFINTGYSCPALGQVTSIQSLYASPIETNIYIAGEHTSPPWFGFMEGALQSGVFAAQQIVQAVG